MLNIQQITDKTAISLSLLCAIHCLAIPVALVLLPSVSSLIIADEKFHLWVVLSVIPISAYALTIGCKKHNSYRFLTLGIIGLLFLVTAVLLGEAYLGEVWEKILTIIGSAIIAWCHYKNYRLCQEQAPCECHQS